MALSAKAVFLGVRSTQQSLFLLQKALNVQALRKSQCVCSTQTARSLSTSCQRLDSFPPSFYHRKDTIDESQPKTGYIESKEDFKFVERLIPSLQPPTPPVHEKYPTPSGWSPAKGAAPGTPYSIRRTRYHSVPVYLELKYGENQQLTVIKNVEGDIWAFGNDLKEHLEAKEGRPIPMRVNEVTQQVKFKGMYREAVKTWMANNGF
ncbi:large ribosomal subunit protein mL49-like [Asterias amurensis]|uniref:large ribosomal subunit protein mL49-like n=1 Tax=Asterias amurensis TaxID=7602 RepID=UPI003AB34225